MEKEKYFAALKKATDPDKLAEALDEIRTLAEADATAYDELQKRNDNSEARIKDLQDSNIKLFLKVTGGTSTTKDDKKDPEEMTFEDVIEEARKMIDNKE